MSSYYYLSVKSKSNLKVLITLNGFPVLEGELINDNLFQRIINECLHKGKNILSILLENELDYITEEKVDVKVKMYRKGEPVLLETGKSIKLAHVEKPGQEYEGDASYFDISNKESTVLTFYQDDFDFPYQRYPVLPEANTQIYVNYAELLRRLFSDGGADEFIEQLLPKLSDMNVARHLNLREEQLKLSARIHYKEKMANELDGVESSALKENVKFKFYCENRITHIYLENPITGRKTPLIKTKPSEDGGWFEMDVFVAMVENELKVVR